MAPHLVVSLSFVGATLVACDVSQQRPETGTSVRSSAAVHEVGGPATRESSSPAEADDSSVRLFGPGIHRQRQTRV